MRAATCLEMKQFPVFFLSGIHAGTDISRLVPWEFPHHVKSSPPKNSEKPGQSAEKRLTQTLCRRLRVFKRPVILQAMRTISQR